MERPHLKYKIVGENEFSDLNWIRYQTEPPVYVFVPSVWGNKRALVHLMQEGLAAALMPGTPYLILEGETPQAVAALVNATECLLMGELQQKDDGHYFQAVVKYSGRARQQRALEMWGELIKERVVHRN